MSADKDRGIRREKQKRVKESKKLAKQQRSAAVGAATTASKAPAKKAA
jgi:hypothetical protein